MGVAATTMRYRVGDLVVDSGRFVVTRDGIELPVPRLSFDLLLELVRAAPAVVTSEQLMDRVWSGLVVSPETVSQRVKLLRNALGDSAAEPRYIASVRGRGYRLLLPVEPLSSMAPSTASHAGEAVIEPPPARPSPRPVGWRWWAGGFAVAAILVLWLIGRGGDEVPDDPGPGRASPSIAVLPFVNRSPRAEDSLFADGIHDDILTRLSQVGGVRVIARTSVETFRKSTIGVREIGRRLGVGTVLEGSVQRDGDRVRINLQLIDAETEAHLWAENFDRELTAGSLFAMQSEVAEAVASKLHARLTEAERMRVQSAPTTSLEAWEAYQAGQRLLARRSSSAVREAESRFDRAIALDPNFALAHVGRANSLILQHYRENLPAAAALSSAEESIARALQLAPDSVEALTAMAGIAEERGQLELAERQYLRAIALNPNYALAPHWYSVLLMSAGRASEGLRYAEAAARLDPYSISAILNLGEALELVGRFDEALQRHLHALDVDPENSITHAQIGMWFVAVHGRLDLGIPWLERGARFDPDNVRIPSVLAGLYADLDWSERAYAWRADAMRHESRLGDLWAAWVALDSGDLVRAARHAERAREEYPMNNWPLRILRDADLAAGRTEAARLRYLRSVPDLARSPLPRATDFTAAAAVDLAVVLQREGNSTRADELLDFAGRHWSSRQRMGIYGYGIADAMILALHGDSQAAIAALQTAQRMGWRGPDWRYARDHEPAFASVRDRKEFHEVFARIARDLAEQRRRLEARPPEAPLARELPPPS